MSDSSRGGSSVNGTDKRKTRRRQANDDKFSFRQLEDRRMLATLSVGNNLDIVNGDTSSITSLITSPGADGISLREAITASNATPGADEITFDPTVFIGGNASLIRLTSGELNITEELTIDGSTGVGVTITGDANGNDVTDALNITDVDASGDALLADNSRVFSVTGGRGVQFDGLTVTGGRTTATGGFGGDEGDGGGIRVFLGGDVTLTNSVVSGNSTAGDGAVSYTHLTLPTILLV